ncbi:MAG: hypothetical protein K2K58_05595, partial [Muribaculaceae bacterium]|nr:hypothetical protein [Muribaculaceae bacterium]
MTPQTSVYRPDAPTDHSLQTRCPHRPLCGPAEPPGTQCEDRRGGPRGGGAQTRPKARTPGEGNLNTFVGSSHPTHGDNPDKGILPVDCKIDRTICPLSEKESLKKL